MSSCDLHTHTLLCDGAASPEEMVQEAVKKGMECIGFSGHSYTWFDESYCMSKENTEKYRAEINRLKQKYDGKIKILCGIEQDYYSDEPTSQYDYVIGSVHYLKVKDRVYSVDEGPEQFLKIAEECYGGDFYSLAEDYFKTVSDVVRRTNADIIGHFDLIAKFNEGGVLFDEGHPRYVKAYTSAVNALLPFKKPFEINTGGMARAGRTQPYPSYPILRLILNSGGSTVLSSDSHNTDNLCYLFEQTEEKIKNII